MSAMPSKAWITTDFPTPEQVAAYFRIPAARVAELQRMMQEMHVIRPDGSIRHAPAKRQRRAGRSRKK
jgi:hypothetical protein